MKTTFAVIFALLVLLGCSDKTTSSDAAAQTEGATETNIFGNASEHQEEISKWSSITVEKHVSKSYRDMMMKGMNEKSDRNGYLGAFDCSTLPNMQPLPVMKTPDMIGKTYTNADGTKDCIEDTYLPNFENYGDVSFTIVTKME